jgi:hypothetical protein
LPGQPALPEAALDDIRGHEGACGLVPLAAALSRETSELVATPHRPLVRGLAARKVLSSLAFSANGLFSS